MARAKISVEDGGAAVRAALGDDADRNTTAMAVRYLLQLLAERAPGNTVEVRVPPGPSSASRARGTRAALRRT